MALLSGSPAATPAALVSATGLELEVQVRKPPRRLAGLTGTLWQRVRVKARAAALQRLTPIPAGPALLVVATGSYVGEGFDCPALDTVFLVAPIAFKGRLVQYVGRILRPYPGKTTAEVHAYHDVATGVLASSLAKRATGYTSLGFPDPRRR